MNFNLFFCNSKLFSLSSKTFHRLASRLLLLYGKKMDESNLNLEQLKAGLRELKWELYRGEISYEEAKQKAKPLVDGINWLVMDICFKYNRRIKTYSFNELLKGIDI